MAGRGGGLVACLKIRRTWIRRTATASFLRLCAGKYTRACGVPRAFRQGSARPAHHLHGVRPRAGRGGVAGDIIGLHNPRTINIGDTFTQGTADHRRPTRPRARRAVLKDPLKMKALQKGLSQLCEEGATQLFAAAQQ
jgi:peptide chain release factor 3